MEVYFTPYLQVYSALRNPQQTFVSFLHKIPPSLNRILACLCVSLFLPCPEKSVLFSVWQSCALMLNVAPILGWWLISK